MKVFIVFAHPSPASLSAYLKDKAVAALESAGHEVLVSDLYRMGFKAVADEHDFQDYDPGRPLRYDKESAKAYSDGTQTPDIVEEQRRLDWADLIILQFPLWWYGMPAILKGWVDRVYAFGFAYGVGPHGGAHWGDRFGDGRLKGKRAMLAVNIGGRMTHYGPRGVNGAIDDILWPIQHGVLFYPGMDVLPPVLFYEVGKSQSEEVEAMVKVFTDRLLEAPQCTPIPFRSQNGGDYDDLQVLKPELQESTSLSMHQRQPPFVSNTYFGEQGDFSPHHFAPTSRDEPAKSAS